MSSVDPAEFFDGTPLELGRAIIDGNLEAVSRLAKAVKLNQTYRQGMTPLFFCITSEHAESIGPLMRSGADPTMTVAEMGSPLDVAVRLPTSKYLSAMIDAGTAPDSRDSSGIPLIMIAACQKSSENLHLLVERSADLDATDGTLGETAALSAFNHTYYDHSEYLIEKGAKVDVTMINGVTFAYAVDSSLKRTREDTDFYRAQVRIRDAMKSRGIKFPADPPEVVRARMKAKGMKVAE